MSLIDFIKAVEESQDEFDVELEEFDADSEQEDVDTTASGGRSYGRLFLVALLLVGVAYVVYRLRSSVDDELFTDIDLDDEAEAADASESDDEATVSVEHDPEAGDETTGDDAEAADDDAVEVEIESPDDESDEE
ncbi:hypothetical protein [Haloferax sp. YSMS24]|uniref:hypothetical protein n=1 Tax=unclassified Haloferax TaxID=2625095 RepID=UPI00398C8634